MSAIERTGEPEGISAAIHPGRQGPPVVALGGGHGLSASLRGLRRVTDDVTAVVGVADNGGSSGRLRVEFGVVPPGDLRMALAALCGDDEWGRTWSRVMQHRFGGEGPIAGHATGNLLITSLWEETGSLVEGLDWMAALLGAHGRVLPVSTVPLEIVATVKGSNPADPVAVVEIRGQVQVEHTPGDVLDFRVEPTNPPACPEAVQALHSAELIVLGPGSWYTSVLAHLLVPGVRRALIESMADRLLVLNLDAQRGDTEEFKSHTYLRVWADQFPDVRLDKVLADPRYVDDLEKLDRVCDLVGAELVLGRLVETPPVGGQSPVHDPLLLAAAFGQVLGRGSISPWR